MFVLDAGIGGFMPRSRTRGSWQMRGGRFMSNSSRSAVSDSVGGDQGEL